MKNASLLLFLALITGCSVFGSSSVEVAPYRVMEASKEKNIELRYYSELVLVSAPMQPDIDARKNTPFSKLFDYISGNNTANAKQPITASEPSSDAEPIGVKIPMTAPVFMETEGNSGSMSFVMPASYSMESTPKPTDPDLKVYNLTDMTYAVIQFTGLLNSKNILEHREILENWIDTKGLEISGNYKTAGYNPPFTIPALRRNEVLIPVKIP